MLRHSLAAVLVVSACGYESATEVTESELSPHGTRQDELRRSEDGIIVMNGLSPEALARTWLLADEVTRRALLSAPLNDARMALPPVGTALDNDPHSRTLLQYLARCALPESGAVHGGGTTFSGQVGLCPEWAATSISSNLVCQQKISACVLSLSNATGRHVPLSVRGPSADGSLSPGLRVRPTVTNSSGFEVRSISACSSRTVGVSSTCGWSVEPTVFSCVPGRPVQIGGGSTCTPSLGSMASGADRILRVCGGLQACDPTSDNFLAQNQGACGSIRPHVAFTCPTRGTYVVMQRPYDSACTAGSVCGGPMTVGHSGSLGIRPESEVFAHREGAFFGNIFEGVNLKLWFDSFGKPHVTSPKTSEPVFTKLYSCQDVRWSTPDAYRASRLCTLPEGQCLTRNVGVCFGTPTSVCAGIVAGTSATGAMASCWGEGIRHDWPLTTFLNRPCDVVGSANSCSRQ